MTTFEAQTLEEVYEKASTSLDCSITDLTFEIIQEPSKGFLGLFKKNAIIKVIDCKKKESKKPKKVNKKHINIKDATTTINEVKEDNSHKISNDKPKKVNKKHIQKERIFDNFYSHNKQENFVDDIRIKRDSEEIVSEIKQTIDKLFANSCYIIDDIKVYMYNEKTVSIEFNGDDSALLIGKEGYRYKALSYILFNWINEQYGLMLRLEVAQFLKNQETSIHKYLEPVKDTIKEHGSFKTKTFDGILVHIALQELREEFPDKYVAIKTNQKGEKYIIVNEYRNYNR
jgi:spoIIIJ-associated protein